jgi:hypothetical protein
VWGVGIAGELSRGREPVKEVGFTGSQSEHYPLDPLTTRCVSCFCAGFTFQKMSACLPCIKKQKQKAAERETTHDGAPLNRTCNYWSRVASSYVDDARQQDVHQTCVIGVAANYLICQAAARQATTDFVVRGKRPFVLFCFVLFVWLFCEYSKIGCMCMCGVGH